MLLFLFTLCFSCIVVLHECRELFQKLPSPLAFFSFVFNPCVLPKYLSNRVDFGFVYYFSIFTFPQVVGATGESKLKALRSLQLIDFTRQGVTLKKGAHAIF